MYVLVYDIPGNTPSVVSLAVGATEPFSGGVTLDGKSLYVGVAGTNTVDRIDVAGLADAKQISVSFVPDLVAVRPH